MKSVKLIDSAADRWIVDEDLPVSPTLKVIRPSDPDYGLTEDEIKDRYEFIRCHLLSEFALLIMIPRQDLENDFFIPDCDVSDPAYSAFNTHDYQRTQWPFNKYAYAMQKIMGRVKDLAIMHSSINQPEDRQQVYERFRSYMAFHFTDEVEELARQLHMKNTYDEKARIRRKIARLSRDIKRCVKIWERFAPIENWDR